MPDFTISRHGQGQSPFRLRNTYENPLHVPISALVHWSMNQNDLSERLWSFAARVGKIVDALPDTRLGRHVAGQLVRCGTSAPPNYDESGAAESRDDFVHKLSVALKELRESRGWLRFIVKAELLSKVKMEVLIDEAEQLCRILGKSVLTAKTGRKS